MASKYIAYYVDLYGNARASYELNVTDDATAICEARNYLKLHPSIEVWQGARWIARLLREEPQWQKGH